MSKQISIRTAGAALGLALFFSTLATAQQEEPPLEGKTAEQVFKNIQVPKGVPATEINRTMHLIKGSLGVDCRFCHVKDASQDVLESKRMARKMMAMVLEINKTTFGGEQVVSCYTCHRGSTAPI